MAYQGGRQGEITQSVSDAMGIGLRCPHVAEMLTTRPSIGWLEVHPENYFGGGPALAGLVDLRRDYPVSLHGVGLSLGSADGIDGDHLQRLCAVIERIDPFLVSDHLSWSIADGIYLNDLLPLPYTEESLGIVADNIDVVQSALKRPIAMENPSSYLRFRHSTMSEAEFLSALVSRTGCHLLCDVNNIYVSCCNFNLDPVAYIDALPTRSVAEIHLAGHARVMRGDCEVLIDDHGSAVASDVWRLYDYALARFGLVPSLVEWDTALPDLSVLLGEARLAEKIAASLSSPVSAHVDAA